MKNTLLLGLISVGLLASSCESTSTPTPTKNNSNHYYMDAPAANWYEALPIGNGRLGAMVFGGINDELIQLNEDTFWGGTPRDLQRPGDHKYLPKIRQLLNDGKIAEAETEIDNRMLGEYNMDYLPLADLALKFESSNTTYSNYRRELDLESGLITVTYTQGGVKFKREYFVSYPDQVMVIRLSSDKGGMIDFGATLTSQIHYSATASGNTVTLKGQAPVQTFPEYTGEHEPRYQQDAGTRFECRLTVENRGGAITTNERSLTVNDADEVILKFVAATSFNGFDKDPFKDGKNESALCDTYVNSMTTKGYDELLKTHTEDFSSLFNRVSIDLGSSESDLLPIEKRIENYKPENDPALTALYYQFGRYLLISSSREGSQPANLQGIWNKDVQPEWSSNYTTNCNVEINYWNAEQGNLSECHMPLLKMIREASVDGARTARNLYDCNGWIVHHNLDIWRTTWPVGGSGLWALFQVGGAWLMEHVWEHYQFTMDKQFLADNYDLFKSATQFYLENLQRDKEGRLVTNPSESFENMFRYGDDKIGYACIGSAQDMQIIRSLFENTIEASKILAGDEQFRNTVEKALAELAPMKISPRTGMLQEWNDDIDPANHLSGQVGHGWALSCDNAISLRKTPELAAAFRKLIEYRKPGYSYNSGSWTGSFPAVYWARLEQGDSAQRVINRHFDLALSKNMTSQFTGFWEIDGNFGIAAAIGQMLLQSQDLEVHLLPALSSKYPKGSVSGLRARGGYTVDIVWENGKLTQAAIKADHDGELKLRHKDNLKTHVMKASEVIKVNSQLEVI